MFYVAKENEFSFYFSSERNCNKFKDRVKSVTDNFAKIVSEPRLIKTDNIYPLVKHYQACEKAVFLIEDDLTQKAYHSFSDFNFMVKSVV